MDAERRDALCFGSPFAYALNMSKTIPGSAKRKRGRPATGLKFPVIVQVRLGAEQADEFDAWAGRQGISRSDAIRQLIADALKRKRS